VDPGLSAGGPAFRDGYAVLNPGAGWDSKRWPVERFADVARHLMSRDVPSIVAWAGETERAWAEQIVAESKGTATLAPPTSLLELAAILNRARLFVGSDTGPLHLAAAVGTRCVALFGASRGEACGPFGNGHITLQAALDESAGRKRPGADNWAMREITSDAVCAACDEVLGRAELGQNTATAA
jgi:ADP-heptose:LPS heptosyltransferase